MRSVEPIPDNPWPHDMTIAVEDRPQQLRDLLWFREAHRLDPVGDDLPPLLTDTPAPATVDVDDTTRAAWEQAWPRIWKGAAEHAGRETDTGLFDRLPHSAPGSPEREALLRAMVGPAWEQEFGRDVFDDRSYTNWADGSMAEFIASRPRALSDSPERRDLDALIPAWRAGLTKIVTIPCRGEWHRTLGPHGILMTDESHDDSAAYRRALESFG
jgi:hypothetical protein